MKRIILQLQILLSFGVLVLALFLSYQSKAQYGSVLFLFFLIHAFLRIWETFFTSKEKDRFVVIEDWTLIMVLFVYIFLFYFVVIEFYATSKRINRPLSIAGFVLYLIAFRLRWWGMAALGKQWAIHAVGRKKVEKTRLIKLGPFQYVRHPIYIATIIEQFGIICLANAYYSIGYFIVITLPAYFVRTKAEEKSNIQKFGDEYIKYQNSVGMFFPRLKILNQKP